MPQMIWFVIGLIVCFTWMQDDLNLTMNWSIWMMIFLLYWLTGSIWCGQEMVYFLCMLTITNLSLQYVWCGKETKVNIRFYNHFATNILFFIFYSIGYSSFRSIQWMFIFFHVYIQFRPRKKKGYKVVYKIKLD